MNNADKSNNKVDPQTIPPERQHLERALSERFNFFLVWVGLITAAAFTANDVRTRTIILSFGALVSALLMLTLNRTAAKLIDMVDLLRINCPDHAVNFSKDPRRRRWVIPTFEGAVFILVGLVVPLICVLGLLFGGVAIGFGWLKDAVAASGPAHVVGLSSAPASQPSPSPVETFSGWGAMLAVLISLVAIVISFWSVRCVIRQNRISVGQRLIDRAFQINEGFLHHKVRSPYASAANLDGDRALTYTANAVMLLQQLNLLRDVYQHRDILPATEVKSYEAWVRNVVAPWVNGNNDLRIAWGHFKSTTDLAGQEFVVWVSSLMSSVSPPSSTPAGGAGA